MIYTDDETAHSYRTVRVPKVKTRRALMFALRDLGQLETGCDCSHCRRDYDCCGRMYPARHRVTHYSRRTGTARIRTTFERNI